MLLLAFLMVSQIKYRSFKDLNLRQPRSYRTTVVIALIIFALALDLKRSLITLATVYVLSGMISFAFSARRHKHHPPAPAHEVAPEKPL